MTRISLINEHTLFFVDTLIAGFYPVPVRVVQTADTIIAAPWQSPLLGLAILAAVPAIAIILAIGLIIIMLLGLIPLLGLLLRLIYVLFGLGAIALVLYRAIAESWRRGPETEPPGQEPGVHTVTPSEVVILLLPVDFRLSSSKTSMDVKREEIMSDDGQAKNIIKVRNLTKKYKEFLAVDGVSFDVQKGEIFAFLGPNGAGKTTTIKMLTTLLKPTGGEIMLDGHDPVKEQDETRRSFGIVFQDPSLDDELTAFENMEFHAVLYKVPKSTRRGRIEELLKFVQLWERRDDQVKRFSGGMKRRLEIARGLLHLPKILFLDEPTLGLDPQTRNLIWGHIKELNMRERITVFLTTHIMEEAERVATKVAIIDRGKIVAGGTPDELKEQTGAKSLEEAFLALTGRSIREEAAGSIDEMRMARRMWEKRR